MRHRRIPSLNWLRVFEAAARSGSFAAAARALNMSGAAVSQQIKALETHLGTPLFERGARSATLTQSGAALLPVVRQSLMAMETTVASLFGDVRASSVTVQATLIFATSWLVDHLDEFEREHPDVRVHLMVGEDERRNGSGPNLRITFGEAVRRQGAGERLFGETLYPVAAPAVAATVGTPRDLLEQRLIEVSMHRANWLALLGGAGVGDLDTLRLRYVDTTELALSMAAASLGVALARAPATDARVRALGLQRCPADLALPGVDAYHLHQTLPEPLSPAARRFRAWLLDVTARHR